MSPERQKKLENYCAAHSTLPHKRLIHIERQTGLKTLAPHMLTGPLQGSWLYLLTKVHQPSRVLEIGTFTGYATVCLASALPATAELITIEANPEYAHLIQQHVQGLEPGPNINILLGDAKTILPTLAPGFDLVYLDANKQDYTWYYEVLVPMLTPGGLFLVDNVLWSGKVVFGPQDVDSAAMQTFNKRVATDERMENVILPLRDGLMVARKK